MNCPRCGNEWDAGRGPCTTCGFTMPMAGTGPHRPITQKVNSPPRGNVQPNTLLQTRQPSGAIPTIKQQSGGMRPVAQPANGLSTPFTPPPGNARPVGPITTPIHPRRPTMVPNTPLPHSSVSHAPIEREALRRVPLGRENDNLQRQMSPVTPPPEARNRVPLPPASPSSFKSGPSISPAGAIRPLLPGTLVRAGRYRLQEVRERQEWLSGVYEAMWLAQDAHHADAQVMIGEVMLPDITSVETQTMLRSATKALGSVGRHPHIVTLRDAFADSGRGFFVFEPIEGESLLSRMRRSGGTLPEEDVVEFCLQMTEVLEFLAQQQPPLVHGLMRPEHIVVGRNGLYYTLTNFSIVLAGGGTSFISGIDSARLSAYSAPEFVRGVIDVRTDLYSLLATAYHAVTGSVPTVISGSIPSAQQINSNVSPQFDAILEKGLHPVASSRYLRPSELRQDLLAIHSVSSMLVPKRGSFISESGSAFRSNDQRPAYAMPVPAKPEVQTAPSVPASVAEALPMMMTPAANVDEEVSLLPRPEDLPPMKESDDKLNAALWLSLILVSLIVLVVLSHVIA